MTAALAPDFTLDHIVGRPVSLADYRGRMVVLVFGGRDSTEQARQISRTLRGRFSVESLPIISVLDLSGVPRMMHGLAKGRIQSGYDEVVRDVTAQMQGAGQPAPADPSQMIVMLPDWDGKVTASFGLKGVDRQAVAVLVDKDGAIRGHGTGAAGGDQVLALLGQDQ